MGDVRWRGSMQRASAGDRRFGGRRRARRRVGEPKPRPPVCAALAIFRLQVGADLAGFDQVILDRLGGLPAFTRANCTEHSPRSSMCISSQSPARTGTIAPRAPDCTTSPAWSVTPSAPRRHQDLQPYYERLRPCAAHRYSGSCRGRLLELLPSHRGDRFLRSSLKPVLASRHLHAGRQTARRQASSVLVPGHPYLPVLASSWGFDTSSVVHLRSSHQHSSDGIDPAFSSTLTTRTLDPRSLR